MINAARKHKVLVQVGFQEPIPAKRRGGDAAPAQREARQDLHGPRSLLQARGDIGKYPDGPMAEGEKFNLTKESREGLSYTKSYWTGSTTTCGSARPKLLPFNRNRFPTNWHWQFEYGNGDTGNQGPPSVRCRPLGLNKDEAPVKVRSFGDSTFTRTPHRTHPTPDEHLRVRRRNGLRVLHTRPPDTQRGGVKIGNVFFVVKAG